MAQLVEVSLAVAESNLRKGNSNIGLAVVGLYIRARRELRAVRREGKEERVIREVAGRFHRFTFFFSRSF